MLSPKVLIIDDDEGILDSTRVVLEEFDFQCMTLSKIDHLFDFILEYKPDLILLDILLSGADGREICIQIKSDERFTDIPIILFSAHTVVKDNFAEFKADDFIEKPFEIDNLIQIIRRHLKEKGVEKEIIEKV